MRNRKTIYPERIQLRVPRGFSEAVETRAAAESCGAHEYIRRLLLAGLRADGVTIAAKAAEA